MAMNVATNGTSVSQLVRLVRGICDSGGAVSLPCAVNAWQLGESMESVCNAAPLG